MELWLNLMEYTIITSYCSIFSVISIQLVVIIVELIEITSNCTVLGGLLVNYCRKTLWS